jgi:hypothetical protein
MNGETIRGSNELIPCHQSENTDQIDRRTSRSICDAVGERLQQRLRPDPRLPTHLEQLLDELAKRERSSH